MDTNSQISSINCRFIAEIYLQQRRFQPGMTRASLTDQPPGPRRAAPKTKAFTRNGLHLLRRISINSCRWNRLLVLSPELRIIMLTTLVFLKEWLSYFPTSVIAELDRECIKPRLHKDFVKVNYIQCFHTY